jgi:tyrosyl-tRNA synthetase
LDLEKRVDLVARNAQEIVTHGELRELLQSEARPRAYWGFELSGLMHIGMGLVCGAKIKDMVEAGFDYTIFLADWHSWINNKLDGNMDNIRLCGEYFKDCFTGLGIKPENVNYRWASDITRDVKYWERVIGIAKSASLQRTWRALPIMGRETGLMDMETAWVFYPCMQSADIFHMNLHVACASMDQRKAHMLARDAGEKLGWKKPVCVHTPLLVSLQGLQKTNKQFDENAEINVRIGSKMSKSVPEGCIFVHDSPEEIEAKLKAAFCPPKQTEGNPVLEMAKLTVFPEKTSLTVSRPSKYGGPKTFNSYEDLEKAYVKGDLHPLDLKKGVADALTEILSPVREYFQKHPKNLEEMRKIEVSR